MMMTGQETIYYDGLEPDGSRLPFVTIEDTGIQYEMHFHGMEPPDFSVALLMRPASHHQFLLLLGFGAFSKFAPHKTRICQLEP